MNPLSIPAAGLRFAGRTLGRSVGWTGVTLSNVRRRVFKGRVPDYVVLTLDRGLAERAAEMPWWMQFVPGIESDLSLEELAVIFQRIAVDPDVRGVTILLKGTELSLSQAQSLAGLFTRFRAWDDAYRGSATRPAKEIVIYAEAVSGPTALLLSAADWACLPPLASWDVLGLQIASTFLKDPLAKIGVEMEVVRVAPWKTAADALSRSEMSDAQRDQLNWLLESLYATLVTGISQGRGMEAAAVSELINRAPLTADEAHAVGLVDRVAYEDELPAVLMKKAERTRAADVKLRSYAESRRALKRRLPPPVAGRVGVIRLEGTIVSGRSRSFPVPLPLLGEDMLGSTTAQQQIRAARQDDRLDAVVVYVDSRGGSALASDLIWRELKLLDAEKPVVVYMGAVAASGGYYIAVAGRKIVAQPATLTGSIGVIITKPVTQAMTAKIGATTEIVRRGDNAGLFQSNEPWRPEQRTLIEEMVDHTYGLFKARVAEGRKLDPEALEPLCGGRVWTGEQARENGLVDALGDFCTAVEIARELAGFHTRDRVETVAVTPEKRPIMPLPGLDALRDAGGLADFTRDILNGTLLDLLSAEQVWLLSDVVGVKN